MSFLLLACGANRQTPEGRTHGMVEREAGPGLSQRYAQWRKQMIADVDYDLAVTLDETSEVFYGRVTIVANLKKKPTDFITVDFAGGNVLLVKVNNKTIVPDYTGYFLGIPADLLAAGENNLEITFSHPYSTDGTGLYRFEDPEDGKVYLYSNFEPYDANKFFPHFDQPDIKARFRLTVDAPKDWQVVSTTRESDIQTSANKKRWLFPQSPKISSYVFSLIAGPYHVWQDQAGDIPLRLMARESLAKYVVPEEWFTYTKNSFEFFQQYFAMDYPFEKYDQIMVPDFNAGAMENVAAVTHNEYLISRGEKTESEKIDHAMTITHEMAHMWFGDLVTMQWWDDLWLNESFATYMGYLSLAENSNFNNVWEDFYQVMKDWAYWSDQLPTTHAIQLPVANTDEAFANFDGITYGKGGAVLKQLTYFIGPDAFREGVRSYLKDMSYRNATIDDFMTHLSAASGVNLERWQEQWLHRAGLNTIQVDFNCKNNLIDSLAIKQSAAEEFPTLRTQRTQLGFYYSADGAMSLQHTLPVTYKGPKTNVPAAKGMQCPQIIFPNEDDWSYVKTNIDEQSFAGISNSINEISNPFTRLMLWQSLNDSLLDSQITLLDYLHLIYKNVGNEKDTNIIKKITGELLAANYYLQQLPLEISQHELLQLEQFCRSQLLAAKPGSDIQSYWFDLFASLAYSDSALSWVDSLLQNEAQINGLSLSQDDRWRLVALLSQHGFGNGSERLKTELERDKSSRARTWAIEIEAMEPSAENKDKWLNNVIHHRDHFTLSELGAAVDGIFPANQPQFYKQYVDAVYDQLESVSASEDIQYIQAFAGLLPKDCSQDGVAKITRLLADADGLHPIFEKALLNRRILNEQCADLIQLQLNAGNSDD